MSREGEESELQEQLGEDSCPSCGYKSGPGVGGPEGKQLVCDDDWHGYPKVKPARRGPLINKSNMIITRDQ